MMRSILASLTAIVISAAGLGFAAAQTGPSQGQPATVPATVNGMPEADLANLLRSLDPNVQSNAVADGGTAYHLTLRRDGWQFQLRVTSFSGSVWIDAAIGTPIADAQQLSAQTLAQLLQANYEVGPSHFSFAKLDNGRMQLYFGRMLERQLLNTQRLREQIDLFCKQVRNTHSTWSVVVAGNVAPV